MWNWLQRLRENRAVLRREVNAVGAEFEAKPYEELKEIPNEGPPVTRVVEGREVWFSAEVYGIKPNGDLEVCIDAGGLPMLLGIKPSYHFFKRPDGAVYY